MADSHPIYSNPNKPQFREPFAIYRSSVSQDTFNAALSAIEPSDELSQPFPPAFPPASSVQEIIAFHRGLCSTSDLFLHPLLLVIVDSDHLDQSRVLLANLGAYNDLPWKVDYMRHPAHHAEGTLASINIGQTDWEETLDNAEFGRQWDRYFAKYPTHPSPDVDWGFWNIDREFRKALEGPERERFQMFPVHREGKLCGGEDVADITRTHLITAREHPEYHKDYFVWFNLDLWNTQREIIVVKVLGPGLQDIRRLPMAEAANMLVDIEMRLREW